MFFNYKIQHYFRARSQGGCSNCLTLGVTVEPLLADTFSRNTDTSPYGHLSFIIRTPLLRTDHLDPDRDLYKAYFSKKTPLSDIRSRARFAHALLVGSNMEIAVAYSCGWLNPNRKQPHRIRVD